MNSHISFVAQQTRLSEWAEQIRDCQNLPLSMKIEEWCQLDDITKASYYWRLQKVREPHRFVSFLWMNDQEDNIPENPAFLKRINSFRSCLYSSAVNPQNPGTQPEPEGGSGRELSSYYGWSLLRSRKYSPGSV